MDWLDEIEARCNSATPGPWSQRQQGHTFPICAERQHGDGEDHADVVFWYPSCIDNPANLDFIEAAREDVPRLIAEVRRLRGELREERKRPGRYIGPYD